MRGMNKADPIELKWNLQISLDDGYSNRLWHQRTHNIVVNTGRQFLSEVITPATLGAGTFTRTQDTVVRYIGFGIGGDRQNSSDALISPWSDAYPAGYGGTNLQPDDDVTVAQLERPVLSSAGLWLKQISTPGTFPTNGTTFTATFLRADVNLGAFSSMPLSEIGLFLSSADPALANGGAGAYPGGTGHMIAYDTFDTISKTGGFQITVNWTFSFG